MKDYSVSLEQLLWKHACDSHARCLRMIELHEKHLQKEKERKEELEKEYPQLKKGFEF